jgi:hypothetical protein
MAALPYLQPDLTAGWLAVGNAVPVFDSDGIISAQLLSSGCLEAAAWCLVADGAWTAALSTAVNAYGLGTGSSFAAPQVAGALAILAEAFPTMTPHELRVRLLASADNGFYSHDSSVELAEGFFHGYSDEFGHGFLDIRAALLPIGTTTLSVGDTSVTVGEPVVMSGAAMGDAVAQSLSGMEVAVTDALSAGFDMQAEALTATAAPQSIATVRMAEILSYDMTQARLAPAAHLNDPFETLEGQTVNLMSTTGGLNASFLTPNLFGEDVSYGVSLSRDLLPRSEVDLELGLKFFHDGGGAVGFADAQADGLGADMAALHLGLSREFDGGAFFGLSGEFGVGTLDTPSFFESDSSVAYDSFGLQFGKRNIFSKSDRLTLGLSMPMAITDGSAQVQLPVVMSDGSSQMSTVSLDLAPQKRQLDLSLTYQAEVATNLEMVLELVHAQNHGNIADLEDTAGILAFSYKF